jgi:hypothetical protein
MRLTKAEKDLICTMCNIAEANADLAELNDGKGDGDYEGWTMEDFKRAERIGEKLFDVKEFAKKFIDCTGDIGKASRAIVAEGVS